jgi:hypothetical protein
MKWFTRHKITIARLYLLFFISSISLPLFPGTTDNSVERAPRENYTQAVQNAFDGQTQITYIPKDLHIAGDLTVDGTLNVSITSQYVKRAGDTMTGALVMENSTPIQFNDSTNTNNVTLAAPASITTSYGLNLPQAQGAQYTDLSNDGSGNLLWTDPTQRVGSISYGSSGFVNQTDSTISFDNSSRTFTIEPTAPLAQYLVYFKGREFVKTTAETFQISNQEGLHYIYFDPNGQLFETFAFAGFDVGPIVAFIYWSVNTQTAIMFSEERHACHRDIA